MNFSSFPSEEPDKLDAEKPIVKEEFMDKPRPLDSGVLSKDRVEALPQKPVIKENNLVDPLPMAPKVLNKSMVSVPPQGKKEFLEGDESTLLVLEESDVLKFTTTATSANISVSVLQQDRT